MNSENSSSDLCLGWMLMLLTTSLVSFALGMLVAKLEFEVVALMTSLSQPALLVTCLIGTAFYLLWLLALVRRTLGKSTSNKDLQLF